MKTPFTTLQLASTITLSAGTAQATTLDVTIEPLVEQTVCF